MGRGQKFLWQLKRKVPKGRVEKPYKIDPGLWYQPSGSFAVYLYHRGRDIYLGTYSTLEEAVSARQARLLELEAGRAIPCVTHERTQLAAFAKDVFFPAYEKRRRASTVRSARARYNVHILPAFADKELRDVTSEVVAAFCTVMGEKKVSGQTRRETILVLGAILKEAKRQGYILANPAADIELPKKDPRSISVPTYADALTVIAAITDPVGRMLAETLLWSGARINEALALQWPDIDLDAGTIFVEKSIDQATGVIGLPKTDAGKRKVAPPSILVERLRAYRSRQQAGEIPCNGAWVFPAPGDPAGDRPLNDRHFAVYMLDPAIEACGVARFTAHAFRHLFCSKLLSSGANGLFVAKAVGHTSASFTLKQYARWVPASDDVESALAERAFGLPQDGHGSQAGEAPAHRPVEGSPSPISLATSG